MANLPLFQYFFSVKKVFSKANLFLLLMIVVVVVNSLFQYNAVIQAEKKPIINQKIRVIQELGYNFGYVYKVNFNSIDYITTYNSPLSVGYVYLINGVITEFDTQTESKRELNLLYKGVGGKLTIKSAARASGCDWYCSIFGYRNSFNLTISRHFSRDVCQSEILKLLISSPECRDVSALAFGFTLGGGSNLSKDVYSLFTNFSLTHLIAVSGFQVVILMAFTEWLLTSIQVSRKSRLVLSMLVVSMFIFLVGFEIPVVRSGISILLTQLVIVFLGKKVGSLRALIYSSAILMILNPLVIFSVSFQLSFLATAGIVLGKKDMITRFLPPSLSETVVETVRVYSFIFLLVLPVIVLLNGQVTVASILINLIILPFIPVTCLLLLLGFIPIIGELFSFLGYMMIKSIVDFLGYIAHINPIPAVTIQSLDSGSIGVYFGVLLTSILCYLLVKRLGYVRTLEKLSK
jgi:ComEC/Rec2-related protein